MRRRLDEHGSASVELVAFLPWLLAATLLLWQLLLVATTVTSAENAARNASRSAGQGAGDAEVHEAALDGLSSWLRNSDVHVERTGDERVTVRVPTPLLWPDLFPDVAAALTVERSAELPATDS